MGRWAQAEYERVLFGKIRFLFETSLDDPLLDPTKDKRFTSFIKNLDVHDKGIQACFRSLVQYTSQPPNRRSTSPQPRPSTVRNSRRYVFDGPSDEDYFLSLYHETDPIARPSIPLQPSLPSSSLPALRPSSARASMSRESTIVPIRSRHVDRNPPLAVVHRFREGEDHFGAGTSRPRARVRMSEPSSPARSLADTLPLSRSPDPLLLGRSTSPFVPRQRSASPSFSPSRARSFPHHSTQPDGGSGSSPPRSPSRAWLEEYSRGGAGTASTPAGVVEGVGRFSSYRSLMDDLFTADGLADLDNWLEGEEGRPSQRRRVDDHPVTGLSEEERRWRRRELARTSRRITRRRTAEGSGGGGSGGAGGRDTRRDGVVFEVPEWDDLPPDDGGWITVPGPPSAARAEDGVQAEREMRRRTADGVLHEDEQRGTGWTTTRPDELDFRLF